MDQISKKRYDFSKDQLKRYRGHMALCEIDIPGQAAICNGSVLIVGIGGLGSPVALYLAAAGVGHIGIVDADTVSLSNLQRQIIHSYSDVGQPKVDSARREIGRVNPGVEVESYNLFLDAVKAREIFEDYDLVMDCTDNFATRKMISDVCSEMGVAYVFGGVSRFRGEVFTHIPGSSNFTSIFGNEPSEADQPCEISGILNTVVGVTGALQATEAIKFLVGTGELLVDRLLVFDALTMEFNVFDCGGVE